MFEGILEGVLESVLEGKGILGYGLMGGCVSDSVGENVFESMCAGVSD